ncbi:aldehyde dehydrogenase family protein [Rhodococcus sp. T2V]|uniref:aldehyde dehydrogenase family protein n=1 Tax=Rhodococcus sp. T2V TaxID=3034164 RepID=UPI0023E2324F|nr:aldehyde dehydrogenase family protein [Rhodococcus sp. T2V]MDF3312139.1 aldehyde dehydrogenase family protein [Rhodococcus sp. T2V]
MSAIAASEVQAVPVDPDVDVLERLLGAQRSAFLEEGPPSLEVRLNRIDRLVTGILEVAGDLADALDADFGSRPRAASMITDGLGLLPGIAHVRENLASWMKDRPVPGSQEAGTPAFVQSMPKGVVGVIGPWNFPVSLVIQPTIEALAAGNRVMIKISEVPSRTADVVAAAVARRMRPDEVVVVRGGPHTAAAFSSLPFNHLIFTGSPGVGARVAEAAGRNLVPLTLELGGKNPVVLGSDADLDLAAERIAGARLINGGQLCLCPDYVFVPRASLEDFADKYEGAMRKLFPTYADNATVTSVVDERNFDRVNGLVADAEAKGARVRRLVPDNELDRLPDRSTRRIPPTLLLDVTSDMAVTSEEIFGPVLTMFPYDKLHETIDYVNAHPSPLAAYFFGSDGPEFREFIGRALSGGVTRNDLVMHWGVVGAPSGGVGQSGMGAYSGKIGYDTFSHLRTVAANIGPMGIAGQMLPPADPATVGALQGMIASALDEFRGRISADEEA